MALPDLTRPTPWLLATGAAEVSVKQFGNETEQLKELISQSSQARQIARQRLFNFEDQASFFLNFSYTNESKSGAFKLVLSYLQDRLVEDVFYDYKLSTMPKTSETLAAKVTNLGRAKPKFHLDFEID